MRKIDLGQTISILANIGVIAGIVFLGYELRQNTRLLDVQIRAEAFNRQSSLPDLLLENPELITLLESDRDTLDDSERTMLTVLGIRAFTVFENGYGGIETGQMNEEDAIRAFRSIWNRESLNYGMPQAWSLYRDRASPEFVDWVEKNVIQ